MVPCSHGLPSIWQHVFVSHKSLNKIASLFKLLYFLILLSYPSITIFQLLSSKFFLPYAIRHILQSGLFLNDSFQITYILKNYINLLLITSKIIVTPQHMAEWTIFFSKFLTHTSE